MHSTMESFSFSFEQISIAVLSAVSLILAIAIIMQEWRLRKILRGKNAKTLEDSFSTIQKEYEEMKKFRNSVNEYLSSVEKRLGRSIQAVSTIRFNPWKGNGEGGNQSFASAFVSEKGDGVVLSSLAVRDRLSIFAKPVEKGKSSYELTNEEKEALEGALGAPKK